MAGPTVMVSGELTAAVNEPSVAVRVYVPARSILQPANVATPATAGFGLVVQPKTAPAGVVIAKVTELVLPVTVLPPASCTVTTGWVAKATVPFAPTGWVVNANFAAAPTVTAMLALDVSRQRAIGRRQRVGAGQVDIATPLNVTTPATAAFGLAVHAKAAPAGVVVVNVTELVLATIVLPVASCTFTTGCTANAVPPVAAALGWVVNATLAATPVISTLALVAAVNGRSVAVKTYVPDV